MTVILAKFERRNLYKMHLDGHEYGHGLQLLWAEMGPLQADLGGVPQGTW